LAYAEGLFVYSPTPTKFGVCHARASPGLVGEADAVERSTHTRLELEPWSLPPADPLEHVGRPEQLERAGPGRQAARGEHAVVQGKRLALAGEVAEQVAGAGRKLVD